MSSTFDKLPLEVKYLMFGNLTQLSCTNAELKEFALVSKAWTSFFQLQLFAKLKFRKFSQFSNYFDAVENNNYLGSLASEATFAFDIDCKNVPLQSVIAKVFTQMTKLKYIDCTSTIYFKLLANALSKGNLPLLEDIKPPYNLNDMNGYVKCVMIIKDRLNNLNITEFSNNDVYGKTLFNNLHKFKALKSLYIVKKNDDIIDLVEKITRVQSSLNRLQLNVESKEDNSQARVIDISGVLEPDFIPANTVHSLLFDKNILYDPQLVLYTIHKFPQAQSLQIHGQLKRKSRLNEYTLNKFLRYLSKMKTMNIQGIPFKEEVIVDAIEPLWNSPSRFKTVNIEINYVDNRLVLLGKLGVESSQGLTTFKFSLTSSDTDSKHIGIIERYGQNIEKLTISEVGIRHGLQESVNSTYNILFLQPLQHCINLKQLTIKSSLVSASNIGNYVTTSRQSFSSLRMIGCTFQKDEFFVNLSKRLAFVEYLEFSDLEDVHNYNTRGVPIMHINMSETDVGTLLLSMSRTFFLLDKRIILVKLNIGDTCTYYKYYMDNWFKLGYRVINETVFYDRRKHYECSLIGVTCKSLSLLKVEQMGQVLDLQIK